MNIGELLKELQGEETQAGFARHLGITEGHYSLLLAGKRGAGAKVLIRLMVLYPKRMQRFCSQSWRNS